MNEHLRAEEDEERLMMNDTQNSTTRANQLSQPKGGQLQNREPPAPGPPATNRVPPQDLKPINHS
jgi:hypothetical protein